MSAEPVTHVIVERTCFHCGGRGRVPGGQREYGEVIDCQVCAGVGRTQDSIMLAELYDWLFGNMRPSGGTKEGA